MVYVFLAEGFEEIEALSPVDILRRGNIDVKTVGVTGKRVKGAHGIEVTADFEIGEISADNLEGIVLPGGMPGTLNLEKNSRVLEYVDFCAENGLLLGAICAAPSILGHKGLLENKSAVCFPGFEQELKGAEILKKPTVKDGNIITAMGAGAAIQFGLALLGYLKDEKTADDLKNSMCCP